MGGGETVIETRAPGERGGRDPHHTPSQKGSDDAIADTDPESQRAKDAEGGRQQRGNVTLGKEPPRQRRKEGVDERAAAKARRAATGACMYREQVRIIQYRVRI